MIASMTGYGHGQASRDGITVTVEVRSVNSRFLEVSARLPRSLSSRENEVKELVRRRIVRGKITLTATMERETGASLPLKVNVSAARTYYRLLNELRKAVRLRETVKLEHLLRFSEVIEAQDLENTDEMEWEVFQVALDQSLQALAGMRAQEGKELDKDFRLRIGIIEQSLDRIEELSRGQVPQERLRLRERIRQLVEQEPVNEGRLELELALMADRMDVTEECVRFRSHNKYFVEALTNGEAAGRKLNFLVQEMNREVNTIGSKSSSPDIAHLVVGVKEELEKVREQLQNIE
jgi:uncharacterized protein (TIGR00255 family)